MLTAKTFTGEMLGNLTGANIPVFHERGELTDRVSTFMRLAQKTEELRIEVKDCFSGFKRFKPNTALMLHQKLECFNLVVRHELIGLAHIGNREISRAEKRYRKERQNLTPLTKERSHQYGHCAPDANDARY